MTANHGSREITERDRQLAVIRDLINSTSDVRITPGMRRALRRPPPPWRRTLAAIRLALAVLGWPRPRRQS